MCKSCYGKFWRRNNALKVKEHYENRLASPKFREQQDLSRVRRNLKKFGITEDAYKEMKKQGCEICGRLDKLHFDHDHNTGEFRGLLCGNHNVGLGFFSDSIEGLEQAIDYLKRKSQDEEVSSRD